MKKRKAAGFTLVELSVVLIIIAAILGISFSSIMANLTAVKHQHTKEKLEEIQSAIAGFLIQNDRLPCPADGALLRTDASFGVEDFNDVTDTCNVTAMAAGQALSGVVPVTSLGLSPEFLLDGWGRRITYAVDRRLAGNDIGSESFYNVGVGASDLSVRISSGSTITDVAYIVFSHGPNGHGAWMENGGSQVNMGTAPGIEEIDNCHVDEALTVVGFNNEFVQWADEAGFDDILMYKTKASLVSELGGIFATLICPDADNIIERNEGVCNYSENRNACEQLVIAVRDRCVFAR